MTDATEHSEYPAHSIPKQDVRLSNSPKSLDDPIDRVEQGSSSKGTAHHVDPSVEHDHADKHHHHSHAVESRHAGGHHLLQVEDLSISFMMYDPDEPSFFRARKKEVPVIRDMSLAVHVGEILALVGASGSGKTLLADAIMGLFEPNALVRGRIWFDGESQDADSLKRLRGSRVSLVPQGVDHLDPLMKVGKQVRGFAEDGLDRTEKAQVQQALFERYDLDPSVAACYPFELSGGMARRVLLASALLDDPQLIVADEPTPGLDLDLAVKALEDFRTLADEGKGILLITHDIELALKVADRVAVFKDGTIIEETAVENFASPDLLEHPFSKALWHALPEHDFRVALPSSSDNPHQGSPEQRTGEKQGSQVEGVPDKKEESSC